MFSKIKIFTLLIAITCGTSAHSQTWDEWFKQRKTQRKYLLQQIAKLQVYLEYLKKGYSIVHSGLSLISDIKEGDFTLHSLFFDHLKQISPTVRHYERIAEILRMYSNMYSAYKSSFKRFREVKGLSPKEIDYLYQVFSNLLDEATSDIDQLTDVLADFRLEMNDNERIRRIDMLFNSMTEKYTSLHGFINKVDLLIRQRQMELNNLKTLKNLYLP